MLTVLVLSVHSRSLGAAHSRRVNTGFLSGEYRLGVEFGVPHIRAVSPGLDCRIHKRREIRRSAFAVEGAGQTRSAGPSGLGQTTSSV